MIDPLTRAELEHNAANASLMADRRRIQRQATMPGSYRSEALSREVRSWETQATSWTAVLALVDAAEGNSYAGRLLRESSEPLRPTDVCSHLSWNPRDDQDPVTCDDCGHRFTTEEWSARMECSLCGHRYHGPDTEDMFVCTQTGCACRSERSARR